MKKPFAVSRPSAQRVRCSLISDAEQLVLVALMRQIDLAESRFPGPNASLLLISYDTTAASRSEKFDALDKAIREGATETVLRPHPSAWLVKTDDGVGVWGERLVHHMSSDDRLIVARIPGAASVNGWLPRAQWEWIKERVG